MRSTSVLLARSALGEGGIGSRIQVGGVSEWQHLISDELRLDVRVQHEHGIPTNFVFQLLGLVDADWTELVRIDNAHDDMPPHRHLFRPDGTQEVRNFIAALPESLVGWAQDDLQDNAARYLEEYRRQLGNMRR